MEGKVCGKCGIWKPLEEYHKDETKKDGRSSKCKECKKQYNKRYYKDNAERRKEQQKQVKEVKEGMKKCTKCGERKLLKEFDKDKTKKDGRKSQCKECKKVYAKQYRKDNVEHIKERNKQYRQDNAEYFKQYYKQWCKDNAENNLQHISSIVEQVSPIFKQLNLPIYGYIYKFENIKTGHVYIGQTIKPLKTRYGQEGGIIKSWIKERKEKQNQKFIDELIEEDFVVTEVLDVACCQYHLNALEVYYINKYDSCKNGYNNTIGNHITDDGLEEFMDMLQQHNLEFIDRKQIRRGFPLLFLWKRKGKLAYLGYLWYNERVINHNEVMYCHI